tara:strand:+ start:3400 stop:4536 length:1137 start_codon:yes stop_codon:yes gene_type:complete
MNAPKAKRSVPVTAGPEDPLKIALPLLDWYGREGRELPWRDTGDPYLILVSELMLQQTRVSTVLNYYPRFIAQFPTLESLAAASEEEVLAQWSGLGFYRRARNLHACAKEIVEHFDSRLPQDPQRLGELPGIGRYTLGAILSAAFNQALPILDGNVARVFSRVYCIPGDPRSSGVQKRLWELAELALPQDRPGDFNQALMDLGATVCKPRSPDCPSCPITDLCGARLDGCPESFPHAKRKQKVRHCKRVAVFIPRADGAFLLHQRPAQGLLAGMWEAPSLELAAGDSVTAQKTRLSRELQLSGRFSSCGTSEHRFSHRHWSTRIYRTEEQTEEQLPRTWQDRPLRWTHPHELNSLALPEATSKILRSCLPQGATSKPI